MNNKNYECEHLNLQKNFDQYAKQKEIVNP